MNTWAPSGRLVAEDLNAAFAEVAQGRMPGALCGTGAEVSVPNVATELPIGQPAALMDVGGYWQAGRLVIPRGLAGWYAITFRISGMAAAVKGDHLRVTPRGVSISDAVILPAPGAPTVGGWMFSLIDHLPDLNAIWIESATTATGCKAQIAGVNLIRLATRGLYK